MATASDDLKWYLLRKNNSFLVKRAPGIIFSKEPANLRNLHSQKYSGLANSKALQITQTPKGIQIAKLSKSTNPFNVSNGKSTTVIRPHSGPRRTLGVAATPAKAGYRPDLREAALARAAAHLQKPKASPPRKSRASSAKKAKAEPIVRKKSKADADDDDLPDLV
ncbi:ribosomal L28e protein family-domain-containing protein [Mycena sp. CBHHK59/15]|nr:ribosomal L28e protein family-domain-containing protein [Mycena sp. CBHHK59/15]